jgi:hypothetical protein
MQEDVITIGKRLVPLEQIALVEPFDPASNPAFKPEREFKSRVVLLNRDTVLAEAEPREFAEAHKLSMLEEDDIAVNPAVAFAVENFSPTEAFKPEKSYATRLKWRDPEGNEQSKLLLTAPEKVISVVLRGEAQLSGKTKGRTRRLRLSRRGRRMELARN